MNISFMCLLSSLICQIHVTFQQNVAFQSSLVKPEIWANSTSSSERRFLNRGNNEPDPCDECGISTESKITGFLYSTPVETFPWIVSLRLLNNDKPAAIAHACYGALVSELHVLTSVRCIQRGREDFNIHHVTVELGDGMFSGKHHKGHATIMNVDLAKLESNDNFGLSVLTLDDPIPFNDKTRAICMPHKGFDPFNKLCKIGNWGFLRGTDNGDNYKTANVITEKAHGSNHAAEQLPYLLYARKESPRYTPFCMTDVGGPLFYKTPDNYYILLGIASHATSGDPRHCVYVNVANEEVRKWIKKKVGKKLCLRHSYV